MVGDDDRVGIFGRLETQSKSTEAASWDGAEGGGGGDNPRQGGENEGKEEKGIEGPLGPCVRGVRAFSFFPSHAFSSPSRTSNWPGQSSLAIGCHAQYGCDDVDMSRERSLRDSYWV